MALCLTWHAQSGRDQDFHQDGHAELKGGVIATRFILIRHGETDASRERRFAGATDVELSEIGRKQAEAVAHRLRAVRIDAMFASPLARCRQTAAPITEVTGRKPTISEDIKECHFGEWEDLAITQVLQKWPEELQRWASDDTVPPPGGECWADLTGRMKVWFDAALKRYEGRTVLAVTHGGPIMALVRDLMQIPRATMDGFLVETASLSVLNVSDGRRRLRLWNDTTHLSEPLLETQGLPGYGPTSPRS